MGKINLEICVDSMASLEAAVAGGADRVELCAALSEGGLTPSYGFMRAANDFDVSIHTMIRPRGGDFCYSQAEIDLMLADIEAAKRLELAGVVLGVAKADDTLDLNALKKLRDQASGMQCTLHRVIDLTPDPVAAVEQAVCLGIDRILTSGGALSAIDGIEQITKMVQASKGQIEIMPGSGVNLSNAAIILRATKANDIHASCSTWHRSASDKVEAMAFTSEHGTKQTVRKNVADLRALVDSVHVQVANV